MKRRWSLWLGLSIIVIGMALALLQIKGAAAQEATVVRVIDGDTIEVFGPDKARHSVRYIGIDTPEKPTDADAKRVHEAVFAEQVIQIWLDVDYYYKATEKNAELVLGKKVKMRSDLEDKDQYGRLLRYVWVGNTFVNAELVKLGMAKAKTYLPNTKYEVHFKELQKEAELNKVGRWSGEWDKYRPDAEKLVRENMSKKNAEINKQLLEKQFPSLKP